MTLFYTDHDIKDTNEGADHIVVWSGGCDSTLLLKETAEYYGTKAHPIIAISIEHYLLGDRKLGKEREVREKIKEEFDRRGLHIKYHTLKVEGDMNFISHTDSPQQTYIWLSMLIPYVRNKANLYLGIIRSDDTLTHMAKVDELITAGNSFLNKTIKLYTPYDRFSKSDIIKELMDYDLYEYIWYCEIPHEENGVIKACGSCAACKTHQMGMVQLAFDCDERAIPYLPKHLKYIKKYAKKDYRHIRLLDRQIKLKK